METAGAASGRGNQLRLAFGFALGAGMLIWFLSDIDWRELGHVLADLRWGWLFLASCLMMLDYVLHAVRWKVLLHSVDPGTPFSLVWSTTAIGWATNTVLPLRAGNFLRPAVYAVKRGQPYPTVLFTTVAEYVCDGFGVLGVIAGVFGSLPANFSEGPLGDLRAAALSSTLVAIAILTGVVLASTRQARRVVERALSPIPSERVRSYGLVLFDQLVAGMSSIGSPLRMLQALAVTAAIWTAYGAAIYATLRAFDLDLPIAASLFLEAALTGAMFVPQAPGFLGVFQSVTEQTLHLFGAPMVTAQAIALVLWVVCFAPVTVYGLVEAWRLGIGLLGARARVVEQLEEQAR